MYSNTDWEGRIKLNGKLSKIVSSEAEKLGLSTEELMFFFIAMESIMVRNLAKANYPFPHSKASILGTIKFQIDKLNELYKELENQK